MAGEGRGRRPNALGSNSQRFAEVPGPDGARLKIPQAKDSITALYLMVQPGEWPAEPDMLLAYNEAELTTGATLELEELRPGQGMGRLQTLKVVDVRLRLERWKGTYVRVKRFVLLEAVPGDELNDLSADELELLS